MKYKVVLSSDGGSERGLATLSFYTRNQAVFAANTWRELGTSFTAYLWDGSTWTIYAPIP